MPFCNIAYQNSLFMEKPNNGSISLRTNAWSRSMFNVLCCSSTEKWCLNLFPTPQVNCCVKKLKRKKKKVNTRNKRLPVDDQWSSAFQYGNTARIWWLGMTFWTSNHNTGFIASAYLNSVKVFTFTGGLCRSWQIPSAILQAYELFNRDLL